MPTQYPMQNLVCRDVARPRITRGTMLCLALLALSPTGCHRGPRSMRVDPPDFDADASTEQAMQLYDDDGNGLLSAEEQKSCPGIASNIKLYDLDQDGMVSVKELQARIEKWVDERTGLMSFNLGVKWNGRPMPNAQLDLQPVDFLETMLPSGNGVTDPRGLASISLAVEDLPDTHKSRRMMPPGLYKVRITHPDVELPARYNTETELGCEVSVESGNPAFPIWFDLRAQKRN